LRAKFGSGTVLVIDNWPVANTRYHEPIRRRGVHKMLRRHRFKVYLLGEFRASSLSWMQIRPGPGTV
ncbi:hypothetical protein BX070DRAFT_195759, partial [Coemansia spiralis]